MRWIQFPLARFLLQYLKIAFHLYYFGFLVDTNAGLYSRQTGVITVTKCDQMDQSSVTVLSNSVLFCDYSPDFKKKKTKAKLCLIFLF